MGDDPFESAWLKWTQAVVNAQVLEDNINELSRQGILKMRMGITQEYDPKRHCIVFTAGPDEVPAVFPRFWGLLLGDIVHNYRASLDHIAWALYQRGRTPNLSKWQEQGVYFPLTTTRAAFNACLVGRRPKLPGVRRADTAIVRRYQPYKIGEGLVDRHLLKVLDDLANADKHRVIQPIEAIPERAGFKILDIRDCVITRTRPRSRRVPLKPGAELARIYVRRTGPEPEIDVEPHFAIDPAINERLGFQEWGHFTMRYIAQLLLEFSAPPVTTRMILERTSHGASPPWLPPSPSKG